MSSDGKKTGMEEGGKPALVPKLRFPEFRETGGWDSDSMGDIYSFKGNNSLSRDKLNYLVGSVKNIHYGDIHTKFATHFDITNEPVPFINETDLGIARGENFCLEGDMIFADASEDLDDIGKSIELIKLNGERLVAGLHTILARQTGDRIVKGFGGHLFKSAWVRSQIQREAQGAKVLGISANRLRNLLLPLPCTKDEQQKIADCLTSLDELITAQARKVDALKKHKKGLMQDLFPREGKTHPPRRFPEFQDGREWRKSSLKCVAYLRNGYAFKSAEYANDGSWQIITISNVQQGNLVIETTKRVAALPHDIQDHQILNLGDILISMTGNVGRVCRVTFEGLLLNQRVGKLVPAKIHDAFFYQVLQRDEFRTSMQLKAAGGAQGNLSAGDIMEYAFYIPTEFAEQQRIAACLNNLDDLITAEAQILDMLKAHKEGLMQQLFPSPEDAEE
jgi:type I restriction enzyme S subunit